MPGAEFYESKITNNGQAYKTSGNNILFLDKGGNSEEGASIIGWWNLIDKRFCGGTAYDVLKFLK